jgi:nucleotide-binding universal stress UspA family protein
MLAGTHGMPITVLHINEDANKAAKEDIADEKKKRRGKVAAASKKSDSKKAAKISAAADPAAEKTEEVSEHEAKAVKVEDPPAQVARKAEEAVETVKHAAEEIQSQQKEHEKSDAPLEVTTIVHELPSAAAVAAEAKKGYDLLLIGLENTAKEAGKGEFHADVTEITQGFDGPLVVTTTRGELDRTPNEQPSILVPVNGTEQAKRGAEVAIVMARATNSPLTVLYVAPRDASGKKPRNNAPRAHQEAILKEVVELASSYNLQVHTAMLADSAANDAILKETERRKHNLIVLGVGRRPGEGLFFGDTAAGLLADAKCSLLFVAT